MDEVDTESTWRQVLGENWEEYRSRTDWMGIPAMHKHVAELMTGLPASRAIDWLDYSLHNYLRPLAQRLGAGDANRKLSLVSFGCGNGQVEQAVLERGWPVGRIVCREFDPALLEKAKQNLQGLCDDQEFQQFDFNQPESNGFETFDVAFFCHSMHHCTDIEKFLRYLNKIVSQDGIILGIDYFGPSRLQMTHDTQELADEIFASFPSHLRRNLTTGETSTEFVVDTAAVIARGDPSEAPRSADLRSFVFSTFPVLEVLPMGGTLLRPLLAHRAGNFASSSDKCILKLLMMLERELIRSRRIQSDNLFFVLGRSSRLE